MKYFIKFKMMLFVAILLVGGTAVQAQTITAPQVSDAPGTSYQGRSSSQDKWQFSLTPYFWMTSMQTKATVRNYSATSNVYFSDILKNSDFAGQVHLEAQKGKWGLFIDPTYLKLSDSQTSNTGTDVRVKIEQWLVEFGGFYRAGKWSIDEKQKRLLTVDILGGGRYWYLSADLDTSSAIDRSKTNSWVDPFIGARLTVDITEKVIFNVRGDIGGFSVGSDFSWNALGVFGYRFTPSITGLLGFRALYVDYKAGTSSIRYEATTYGPIMGLNIAF
jgi:hypothetical protein